MLMNLTAIGCFLIAAGVVIAMWQSDARNKNRSSKDNADSLKSGKGGETK